ncbi:MAG TPA: 50S ribosomal protein L15 [Saprospiraceae bacterium]|nr:50S ribosomal protein L15 [Saprospiraceae bacterium]MCC6689149.1 50S ribosomal protein L15 [Saprospiraceae bacterium]HMW74283.1 50S ribosomal protein L15 [Saprospiraceae bacterium]HMX82031.1 50S ribosomal protein L15 [Saprospiraceae bacterium]HMX85295.1 50S ribosomal protein L15 [Saprospiraceae bacterium]
MKLHTLRPAKGAVKKSKRIARGQGSGHGGTATRGHKGAGSRSGNSIKRGFEGGQMPLQRRIPKRGFKNINRIDYVVVNLSTLQNLSDKYNVSSFDIDFFVNHGIAKSSEKVKVLANGTLKSKISVVANAASEKAKQTIEQLGGSINLV